VDDAGHPEGVLVSCQHRIDGVSLYWPGGPQHGDAPSALLGEWRVSAKPHQVLRWRLDSVTPGSGVTVMQGLKPAQRDREYSIYGWTDDNSTSASGPDFRFADLPSLQPGELLVASDRGAHKRLTLRQLRDRACS
jgi:hypothetical protein